MRVGRQELGRARRGRPVHGPRRSTDEKDAQEGSARGRSNRGSHRWFDARFGPGARRQAAARTGHDDLELVDGRHLVGGYLVDAYWPVARLVVELDSYEFHSDREAFERDRRKIADLRLAGYEVLPITHRQLDREPAWVVDTVRTHLRRVAAK